MRQYLEQKVVLFSTVLPDLDLISSNQILISSIR